MHFNFFSLFFFRYQRKLMKLVSIDVQETGTSNGYLQPLIVANMGFTQTFSLSDIFPNIWMDTTITSMVRKFMPTAESRVKALTWEEWFSVFPIIYNFVYHRIENNTGISMCAVMINRKTLSCKQMWLFPVCKNLLIVPFHLYFHVKCTHCEFSQFVQFGNQTLARRRKLWNP